MKALPYALALALSACSGADRLPAPDRLPDVLEVVVRDGTVGARTAVTAEADGPETSSAAAALATMLVKATTDLGGCFTSEGQMSAATLKPPVDTAAAFVVSFDGNVLRRPTRDVLEGDPFTVAVVGPRHVLPLMRVGQASAGDPDVVRYFGKTRVETEGAETEQTPLDALLDTISQSDATCGSREIRLGDFAAGAETFTLAAALAGEKLDVATVPFSVQRRYVGTLTFGGVYSWLEVPSYGLEPVSFDSTDAPVRVEATARRSGYAVVGFAPAIYSRRHGFGPRPVQAGEPDLTVDGFVGVSVTAPLDNLFVGGSIGYAGIVQLNLGFHGGKVRAVREGAPVLTEELPSGTTIDDYLRDDWKPSIFAGVSIDAASASAAFAKGIRGLLDAP